jgi:hypothetical protein
MLRYLVYNTLSGRFRELADSGLLHGKQFRVGFGQSWVHTRLEGGEGGAPAAAGLVSLATILQRPDPEVLFSIQNWLQVSNNGFILIRITKQGQFVRIRIRKSRNITVNPEAFFPRPDLAFQIQIRTSLKCAVP